ncbi:lipoate--protein ligase family protein [Paenibacillus sp. DS2015]|uniref:lipoate--protein ligase family protein n=1 Tax=Paenibacillus sp. DS2015 TaxID=3373917 RepID=UPI003D1E093D
MNDAEHVQLENILILDRMNDLTVSDALYPFALDELLCRHTGKGGPAVCHIWRHPRAFIMGLRDSRLPQAEQSRQWLESQDYEVAIRNSGGAAVPLDLGVVNISLILPKQAQADLHFHRDFERMYKLIQLALIETGSYVDKGEIAGAYCPGDFDLSIAGRKFCGIAQRRQAHAYVVQAFVIAEGSGQERAQLVHEFYKQATTGADSLDDYPQVVTNSTASLEELTNMKQGAAHTFADAVKRVIQSHQTPSVLTDTASKLYLPAVCEVLKMTKTLRTRYEVKS